MVGNGGESTRTRTTTVLVFLTWIRLRDRWQNCVAVSVILGVVLGTALFAVAGARRTQSSYDRFLRAANASTMSVATPTGFVQSDVDAVAALVGVAHSGTYVGFQVLVLVDGKPDFRQALQTEASLDGAFFDQDRFAVRLGRRPDPSRPDEVAFNELAAHLYGYQVGQRLHLGVYRVEDYQDPTFFANAPPPQTTIEVTVAGVGSFTDELFQDEADRSPRMLMTQAFTAQNESLATYGFQGLVLARGDAGVASLTDELGSIREPGTSEVHVTSVDREHARRALRPLSIVLVVFGAMAVMVALVLGGQALRRMQRRDLSEVSVLRSLGASSRTVVAASLIAPLFTIAGTAVVAAVVAVSASPLMPLGPARPFEAEKGIDVDVTVIGLGVAVVAVVLAGVVLLGGHAMSRSKRTRAVDRRRPGRLGLASAISKSPIASIGLGMALDSSGQSRAVPMRSVMAGTALAVAALVGAISFDGNLQSLTHTPALYGWNWDAAIFSGDGYDNLDPAKTSAILAADQAVAAWSGAYFGSAEVDRLDVPLLGMDPSSQVLPPVVRGRSIANDTEIVLGTETAAAIGKGIGDSITLGSASGSHVVRIVGIMTFPSIGRVHVEHVSLGVGGLVAPSLVPGYDRNLFGALQPGVGPNVAFLRFSPGTDAQAELANLRGTTAPLSGVAGLDVLLVKRPSEIVIAATFAHAPLWVTAGFAVLAALSLCLALIASVRRRRRDLAVLRALGFTGRQLGQTVVWNATFVMIVGLAIGVPVGVVGSNTLWRLFAHQIEVVARPRSSAIATIAIVAVALVAANLAAIVPARQARKLDAAVILRS
ncbi:MAG: FtsX-like permease family protein [Ilumatobacteraceae bacterium]